MGAIDGWNDAIVRLRRKAGLKQGEAAQKAGLSPSQLSRYEAGVASPNLRTLGRLLDIYGADLQQLAAAACEGKLADAETTKYVLFVTPEWSAGDNGNSWWNDQTAKKCRATFRNETRESVLDALFEFFLRGEMARYEQEGDEELDVENVFGAGVEAARQAAIQRFRSRVPCPARQKDYHQGHAAGACVQRLHDEEVQEDNAPDPAPSSRSKSVGAGQGPNRRG